MQLPTGSCVLKHISLPLGAKVRRQLPTGSCVLKPFANVRSMPDVRQLPTGSCVLKQGLLAWRMSIYPSSYLRVAVC